MVVIGSGPGGSAFAALMAHAGHQVTLLERNAFPGGRCSSFSSDGFVLDTGVHMFGRGDRGPFGEISRILGEGPRWSAVTPAFTVNLRDENQCFCASPAHPLTLLNLIKGGLRRGVDLRLSSLALKSRGSPGLTGFLSLARKLKDRRHPLYFELQDITVRDFSPP